MNELPFDLTPFTKRKTPVNSRIHTEFTEDCRERLAILFCNIATERKIDSAFEEMKVEYGRELRNTEIRDSYRQASSFIRNEDHELVLEYIEYLYNIIWNNSTYSEDLIKYDSKIRRILEEERILVRLNPSHKWLRNHWDSDRRELEVDSPIKITFEVVGSQALLEADKDLQQIAAESNKWSSALEPYNEAWSRYQEDMVDPSLFQKLNRALEKVIYNICKDENSWVDDKDGLGACLNELREREFFAPNNELYGEWSKLTEGIKIAARKPGKDKHRHNDIRSDYALLVLHQVAAFLTFVIQRYEEADYDSTQ